jgi:hypothetical protein
MPRPAGLGHLPALGLALALATPAWAGAQEVLPPPPLPPSDELTRDLPPPTVRPAPRTPARRDEPPRPVPATARPYAAATEPPPRGTIGEGPLTAAGSIGAPLHPDELRDNWRYSLASGVIGRFGGIQISDTKANSSVLLYFGGQADGVWTEEGRAARLRLRLLTGGEQIVFIPSDGEIEAAYMLGRREFRFVLGRAEVARYTGLAIQSLVQLATLPSVEGSFPVAADKVRVFYAVAPVELAYVWYAGDRHLLRSKTGTSAETERPDAATAARLRLTFNVPPAVLLSLEGELLKFWGSVDMLTAAEASAGVALLDRTVLLNIALRWEGYTRRANLPGAPAASADQFLGMAAATLVF